MGVGQRRYFPFTVIFHFLGTSQEIKEAGQLGKRTDQLLSDTITGEPSPTEYSCQFRFGSEETDRRQ